jgi:hypothetical protein
VALNDIHVTINNNEESNKENSGGRSSSGANSKLISVTGVAEG